jgi:hypothetical protein
MDPMGMVLMRFQNYVFTNVSFHHPMVSKTSVCVKKICVFMGMVKMALALVNPVCLIFGYFGGTYD